MADFYDFEMFQADFERFKEQLRLCGFVLDEDRLLAAFTNYRQVPEEAMSRDLRRAAGTLKDREAAFLVKQFYAIQELRMSANLRREKATEAKVPHDIINWFFGRAENLEKQIALALDHYTRGHVMGGWLRGVYGIGPILAAGFLAHLDITKAPTVGHFWQFAGIAGSGNKPWNRGEKRPYNVQLRTLCWKAGQSFMKFSNRPECAYGGEYRRRKERLIARNETGGFAERAARFVEKHRYGKETEAYKTCLTGRVPPSDIDAMARQQAVKIFLSDLHAAWYEAHFDKPPPLPYPIAILGHAHHREAEAAE